MKKIFKNGKRSIAAIMVFCITLSMAGICVYAVSSHSKELTEADESIKELMPEMASATGNYTHYYNIVYYSGTRYVKQLEYARYNSCGNIVGGPWQMSYSLADQFEFYGCQCPRCN